MFEPSWQKRKKTRCAAKCSQFCVLDWKSLLEQEKNLFDQIKLNKIRVVKMIKQAQKSQAGQTSQKVRDEVESTFLREQVERRIKIAK